MLGLGFYWDSHTDFKYTDIDYKVYTDASRYLLKGGSPYDRHTYRYTPLIAYLMIPNLLVHEGFGKVLFLISDIACGILILLILKKTNNQIS